MFQTATNPRTGERVVLRNGRWEPINAPSSPRILPGPPLQPSPRHPDQITGQNLQNVRTQQQIEDATLDRRLNELEIGKREREAAAAARAAQLPGGGQASADQSRFGGFALRARSAHDGYNELGVGPPPQTRLIAQSILPESAVNRNTDPARQQADTYQREFVSAILRYESGAAIPPNEIEDAIRRYFPQAGDSPENIETKRRLRETAIQGLVAASGPLGPWSQEGAAGQREQGLMGRVASEAMNLGAPAAPRPPAQQQFAPYDGQGGFSTPPQRPVSGLEALLPQDQGNPLTPEMQAEYNRFIASRPSPDQVRQWFEQRGYSVENPARAAQGGNLQYQPAQPPNMEGAQGLLDAAGTVASLANPLTAAGTLPTLLMGGTDAAASRFRGAMDTATLGSFDEVGGFIGTPFSGQTYDQNVGAIRAVADHDARNNPIARLQGQIEGGFALPMPAARAGQGVNLLARYAPQMKAGAAYGGGYGFGSGDGSFGTRAANATFMAGLGALAPPALDGLLRAPGAAVRGIRSLRTPPPTPAIDMGASTPLEVAEAMRAEGIRGPRAIADPAQRGPLAVAETTPGGHHIVTSGLADTRAQIANRAAMFSEAGVPQPRGVMGETIQSAGERRLDTLRTRARNDYTAADRQARADFTAAEARRSGSAATARATVNRGYILPTSLASALDERIALLARNEPVNAPTINLLNTYRRNITGPNGELRRVTIQDLRDMRTGLSGHIAREKLHMTNAERLVNEALDAAGDDVVRAVGTVSPRALRRYQNGDGIWRQMSTERVEVIESLIGPANNRRSGEATVNRLVGLMRPGGDYQRFRRTLDILNPEERSNYIATIFDNIGRKAPGEPFSPALLVSHLRGFSDESLGRLLGKEGLQSVRNLRVIARAFDDMDSARNRSRSGFVMNMRDLAGQILNWRSAAGAGIGTAIGGIPGGMIGAAAGQAMRYGGEALSARALMNPDVSRWLAQMVKAKDPGAVRRLIREAAPIMRRNPAIAAEFEPVVNAITASNDDLLTYSGGAAASGDERRR